MQTLSAADDKRAIFELRRYQMRNTPDAQVRRTTDFLRDAHLPAVQRAGGVLHGAFNSVIAPDAPFLLTLTSFPSLAAMEQSTARLADDRDYQKAADAYHTGPQVGYGRMESHLYRAFETMPVVEVPSQEGRTGSRLYELRVYESNTPRSLARKVRMFNEGEIGLFRKLGMVPVFFGEAIAGDRLPHLAYLLGYDDMAAREKVWTSFVTSPEWKKMSAEPGVSDAEIVSNISSSFLRGLPFSPVR